MKYLLWVLGLFAAAVALAVASHNAAYVLLVYPPYRIELSFTLFNILLLIGFGLGYVLVRVTLAAVNMPAEVREFRLRNTKTKSRELLDEVLSAYFEGRYGAAERAAARAMELGETSALHPIIAARSAHELHEFEKRDAYLSTSEGKSIGDSTMRLMATTKFMLDQRNPREALKALQKLSDSGVKGHVGALSLELKAQQQAGNWDEVLRVLDQLEKRESTDWPSIEPMRQQAWLEKIRQQQDLTGLTSCLKYMPVEYKLRGRIAAAAAQVLIQHDGHSLAKQLLADSLNAQWDSGLVILYGDCGTGDLVAQIEQAEKWLNQHSQDAGLLLALGKLCLQQKLWGKAQSYLDASISLKPSYAAYTALGRLTERLGKSDAAFKYYQSAMAVGKQ
jgi:HemY protein